MPPRQSTDNSGVHRLWTRGPLLSLVHIDPLKMACPPGSVGAPAVGEGAVTPRSYAKLKVCQQHTGIVTTLVQKRAADLAAVNALRASGASHDELHSASAKLWDCRPICFRTLRSIPVEWLDED